VGKVLPRPLRDRLRKFIYYYPQGNEGQGDPHFREYSVKEVEGLFEKNGFALERIAGGVLRVPWWPLFERFSFLVVLWNGLDRLLDKLPFGIHLKMNFIVSGRRI